MSDKRLTKHDAVKIRKYAWELRSIIERDLKPRSNLPQSLVGSYEYMIRAAIEALDVGHLFYDLPASPFNPPVSDEHGDVEGP